MSPRRTSRRSGGRSARHDAAQRDTNAAFGARGMPSGAMRSLTDRDKSCIHAAALDVLETVGIGDAPDFTRERLTAAGCRLDDAGRVRFPRSLVEDTIARANRALVLHGQRPEHDIDASGSKTWFSTGCDSVRIVDPESRTTRPTTAADVYDFARLVDSLDHVHMFHRLGIPTDIEDTDDVDINLYGIPNGSISGIADSKLPDAQSGFEKGVQHALVGNSGGNVLFCAAGALAAGLGCSHAGVVIDNEIIGTALRTVAGFEVNEETMGVDMIREVCLRGPGHYLGHEATLGQMKRGFYYPTLSDRSGMNDWQERGSRSMLDHATAHARRILDSHFPERLRNLDADAHSFLCGEPLTFHRAIPEDAAMKIDSARFRVEAPVFSTNAHGQVTGIRYHPRTVAPVVADEAGIERMYRARRALEALSMDPSMRIEFQALEGECTVYDNHRVMHARKGFEHATSGVRHFRQCHVDREELHSRWRLFGARLGRPVREEWITPGVSV